MPIDEVNYPEFENIAVLLAKYDIDIAPVRTSKITVDSRLVEPRSIFVALKGEASDGRDYIDSAVKKGAALILIDSDNIDEHGEVELKDNIQRVYFFELSKQLGEFASSFYQDQSRKMLGVAVTGTNGKTSVAHLIASLSSLVDTSAGTIGTMGVNLYSKNAKITRISKTLNTTPDIVSSHYHCSQLKQNGARRYCIEASSHGLAQGRLQGLRINTGIFTNLTQDHLDYHRTFEAYAKAKRKLLTHPGLSSLVINIDDPEGMKWLAKSAKVPHICVYSCADKKPMVAPKYEYLWASQIRFIPSGVSFKLETSWGDAEISLPLLGNFNVYNLLASLGALLLQSENFEGLVKACDFLQGVPGRMELYKSSRHGNVIVDYAHTPDAIQQALIAARQHCLGKLVIVFGCGGDRDSGKRTKMGRIAQDWADEIWLTQDNSRTESPEHIVAEILAGISNRESVNIEIDRKSAIKQAYLSSSPHDLIIVAGKGHEEHLEINGTSVYYNERDFVNKLTSDINL